MSALIELKKRLEEIEEKIGYVFSNQDLLILAFVHRSFVNEHRDLNGQHNERLEFLGDSVLGLIVSDYLYQRLPDHPEGQLSQLRSRIVDAISCSQYLQKIDLAPYILLGRGEKLSEGRTKVSILADVFEAIMGAIYLDGGWAVAKSFFLCHFEKEIETTIGSPPRNHKAELQDYSQKLFQKTPVYKVLQETGPDHSKIFQVVVFVDEKEMGKGTGASKKEAEQQAALDALSKLEKESPHEQE